MNYVLAVDGGNTKTIALVARVDGTILGWGRSGGGGIYGAESPHAALEQVDHAVRAALDMADIESSELTAACFSMAGADWAEDFALLEGEMEQRGYGARVLVVNDAIGALRAGSPDGTGVVVVCGTGVAIGARAADGRFWHSSFWQEPQGAVDLGFKTLSAVYRAELGIEPPTTLTSRVLAFFDLPTVESVLHLMTSRSTTPPAHTEIGRLVRTLMDEASHGDAVARRLVEQHGAALGDYALVAARRVGIEGDPFTLVLAGGVLRHEGQILAETIIERVRQTSPDARPLFSRYEPVVGALFLALEEAKQVVDDKVLEHVDSSLPPVVFFAT
jgi:N-acetylglucosamine kinase-like BadF-type ATPase